MQRRCLLLRQLFSFRASAAKPLPGRWPWNPWSCSCCDAAPGRGVSILSWFCPPANGSVEARRQALRGLCLQRSYNTSCFPWHDTAWQNKVFILCTCQLRSTGSEMMKYYRICCCLFPLGTCADLFKVSSAPSKCFIYYSWHLKMSEGNVSRHHANIIFFICCCLLMS